MDEDAFPEQWSAETAQAVREAAADLGRAVQDHAAAVLGMRGRLREVPTLFALHEQLTGAVAAYSERVSDHTGTVPLALVDEDEDEEGDQADEDDLEPAEVQGHITVVSRFDLAVVDAEALLAAGRAAYLEQWERDDEDDAEVAVDDVVQALRVVLHEVGEPLFEVPGTEPVGGARVYVLPAEPPEPPDEEEPAGVASVRVPDGELAFSEDWVFG